MRIEIKATEVFYHILESTKRYIAEIGGRGSSKSFSVAQYLTYKLLNQENARILAIRKALPSAKLSVQNDFVNKMFPLFGVSSLIEHRYQDRMFKFNPLGSLIHITSVYNLAEQKKLKSTEWNYIWIEEGIEQSLEIVNEMDQILRAPHKDGEINQLIISANPDDEFSYLKTDIIDKNTNDKWDVNYSNWEDNKENLPREYINQLLSLKDTAPDLYRVYTLGEWGRIAGLIYKVLNIIEKNQLPDSFDTIGYGLDFGYTHPIGLVEVGIKEESSYILRELKRSNLTTPELIQVLKEFIPDRSRKIFADPSRPDTIEEISRAGFNIEKGNNDVGAGIRHNKSHPVYILGSCVDFIKEARHYVYKAGTDDPVKFQDDLLDGWRYFDYSFYKMKGAIYVV